MRSRHGSIVVRSGFDRGVRSAAHARPPARGASPLLVGDQQLARRAKLLHLDLDLRLVLAVARRAAGERGTSSCS